MNLKTVKDIITCPDAWDLDRFFYDYNDESARAFLIGVNVRYRKRTNNEMSRYIEMELLEAIILELEGSAILPGIKIVLDHARRRLIYLHEHPTLKLADHDANSNPGLPDEGANNQGS